MGCVSGKVSALLFRAFILDCFGFMMVGMVDNTDWWKPPPPPKPPTGFERLAENYARSNQRRVDDMVKYGGETGGLGSRTADLLVGSGVSDSPGLRAGALAGDVLLNPEMLIPGIAAAKGAQTVGRTALGTTARTLKNNPAMPPGVQNLFELYAARHASPNPNLSKELAHPRDVPVSSGRDWGPGFYFDADHPLSSNISYVDRLGRYGENFYQPKISPIDAVKIALSRGSVNPRQDLGFGSIAQANATTIDSPIIQEAMRNGFTGVRGWTNWLVGNTDRVGGLPNLGVRPVTAADDANYAALESLLRRIFPQ